eukprot:scaffold1350_cov249-Pinguiococcus_pyrenoidosus.AAC.22
MASHTSKLDDGLRQRWRHSSSSRNITKLIYSTCSSFLLLIEPQQSRVVNGSLPNMKYFTPSRFRGSGYIAEAAERPGESHSFCQPYWKLLTPRTLDGPSFASLLKRRDRSRKRARARERERGRERERDVVPLQAL